jgi:N-acetylmuramoyl-L-alanine amidase
MHNAEDAFAVTDPGSRQREAQGVAEGADTFLTSC